MNQTQLIRFPVVFMNAVWLSFLLLNLVSPQNLGAEETTPLSAGEVKIYSLMQNVMIEHLNFDKIPCDDAIRRIIGAAEDADPQHESLGVTIRFDELIRLRLQLPVTVHVTHQSLGETLRMFAQSSGYQSSPWNNGHGINLSNLGQGDGLFTRFFDLSPKYLRALGIVSADPSLHVIDVAPQLEARGCVFRPGQTAIYDPSRKVLTVKVSYDALEQVIAMFFKLQTQMKP